LRKLKVVSNENPIIEELRIEIASPSDIEALKNSIKKAENGLEEAATNHAEEEAKNSVEEETKNCAEGGNRVVSATALLSEIKEKVGSLKRDILCQKYELKKLKNVSGEPSDQVKIRVD
jgi:phage shock protein A